jgi:hypothetical protein
MLFLFSSSGDNLAVRHHQPKIREEEKTCVIRYVLHKRPPKEPSSFFFLIFTLENNFSSSRGGRGVSDFGEGGNDRTIWNPPNNNYIFLF